MKIAYFGYDYFSGCWDALLRLGHEVVSLYTVPVDGIYNTNTELIEKAKTSKVPVFFHRATSDDLHGLKMRGCDLLIIAAYPYRLPVRDSSIRGINIHPSLLPEGKGPWPLPYAILNNLERTGVTIHKLSNEFDSGDILAQEEFPVSLFDTGTTLALRCQMTAPILLESVLVNFEEYWSNSRPQFGGSYFPFPSDELQTLSWTSSVEEVVCKLRAFANSDCSATINERPWNVRAGSGWIQDHDLAPGTVVKKTLREFVIAVKDGFVCLTCQEPDATFREV